MNLYSATFLSSNLLEVEVEAFSKGSIVVDYYVKFTELISPLSTQDLKDVVNEMVAKNNNSIGHFTIDASRSDFIVVGGVEAEPVAGEEKDDELLPQWGIAVVVIGMASLAFVIIFGVSMLSKRQKLSRSNRKQQMLTEDLVYEMNRSGSLGYGIDNPYSYGLDVESWKSDAKYTNPRYKRGSSSSSGGGTTGGPGAGPYQTQMYDSWKTEWNPAYKDYHTSTMPQPKTSYMTKGGRRPSYDDDF